MIREKYLNWLMRKIFPAGEHYHHLCEQLHAIPFNDQVPNDYNRSAEGRELRREFLSTLSSVEMGDYTELEDLGLASVLEVLIALSRRADFVVGIGESAWAMKFLENLNLLGFDDRHYRLSHARKIDEIVRVFNNREYTRTGEGGIFPLKRSRRDQRRVELWYQMSAYIKEQNLF
jgi:hypothetical protein